MLRGLPCKNRKRSAESPFDSAINSAALSLFLTCIARNIASRDSFYVICQRMRLLWACVIINVSGWRYFLSRDTCLNDKT